MDESVSKGILEIARIPLDSRLVEVKGEEELRSGRIKANIRMFFG